VNREEVQMKLILIILLIIVVLVVLFGVGRHRRGL
jgi:hypothetical protein